MCSTVPSFAALHRFGRVRIDREILASRLTDDPLVGEAVERDGSGAIALSGRSALPPRIPTAVRRAARLRGRALRVARILRHTPFVRGILLTGSVAAEDAPADADVDLLVIVADDRIGTVFALLGTTSRLVGRRWFCPNFYLAESQLPLQPSSVYIGRELGQAAAIVGDANALRGANPWLEEMFPNLGPPEPAPMRAGSRPQRCSRLSQRECGRSGGASRSPARPVAPPHALRGRDPRGRRLTTRPRDGAALPRRRDGFGVPAQYEERRQALAAALRDEPRVTEAPLTGRNS